jgi:hypothetical protein
VTWEQATHKIGSLNTIALLAFHINYYIEGILDYFEQGTLEIRDKYSFEMPPISSREDWEGLQGRLFSNAEKFAAKVEQMTDEKLEAPFFDVKYGNYRRNIEGVIEHSYYHLGQISLLKKIVAEPGKE